MQTFIKFAPELWKYENRAMWSVHLVPSSDINYAYVVLTVGKHINVFAPTRQRQKTNCCTFCCCCYYCHNFGLLLAENSRSEFWLHQRRGSISSLMSWKVQVEIRRSRSIRFIWLIGGAGKFCGLSLSFRAHQCTTLENPFIKLIAKL